jgi:hypothetical protein
MRGALGYLWRVPGNVLALWGGKNILPPEKMPSKWYHWLGSGTCLHFALVFDLHVMFSSMLIWEWRKSLHFFLKVSKNFTNFRLMCSHNQWTIWSNLFTLIIGLRNNLFVQTVEDWSYWNPKTACRVPWVVTSIGSSINFWRLNVRSMGLLSTFEDWMLEVWVCYQLLKIEC